MNPAKLNGCVAEARGIVEVVASAMMTSPPDAPQIRALEGAVTILSFVELMLDDMAARGEA